MKLLIHKQHPLPENRRVVFGLIDVPFLKDERDNGTNHDDKTDEINDITHCFSFQVGNLVVRHRLPWGAVSASQRETILAEARKDLSEREVEALLATGAVSETTDLYREMWAVLEPLMG